MRTVKEPDVRKQEILEGAIRVFAKYGYDKTTMTTLSRELHISQGLCYRYFPSKEDIYHAAIEKYADLILEEYLQHHQKSKPIREQIDNISGSIARLMEAETKDEGLYALFHSHTGKYLHNELLLAVAAKILPYLQTTLRNAKNSGEITISNPEQTAVIGLYGELGLFFTGELTNEERNAAIRTGWERLLGL